ncbi:MAG: hypothetical protein KBC38_01745 [Candidatus Pacebacteria bacterium]|nr:hypothetical protein [Candidatus Paceibacterota bacterium]MBP9840016.1 hypothetical protein [Candidatus Paceibacterota bacterium]
MNSKGHNLSQTTRNEARGNNDFVLEKAIFSNIFDKDIRRVYIYKKAERLARAVHLVTPAFGHSDALRERSERTAIALIDGAVLPPLESRVTLSRELLSLSSLMALARTTGLLSPMNADMIAKEAENLLHEIAGYEEPRLLLGDTPSLAELHKTSERGEVRVATKSVQNRKPAPSSQPKPKGHDRGVVSDSPERGSRRNLILDVLKEKGSAYIKDVSTTIRGVSEKTVQRELQALVQEGVVKQEGKRRWTTYSLAGSH